MAHPDHTGGPASAMTGTLGTDAPLSLAPVPPGEPAFADHRPRSAPLVAGSVHSGLPPPARPTDAPWSEEMASPRGRIYLLGEGLEGEPMTPAMVEPFDACLGCMACVTACPSGVQYDKLIAAA